MNRPHIKASIGVFLSGGHTYLLTGVGIFCLMLLRTIKLHRVKMNSTWRNVETDTPRWKWGRRASEHQSSLNKMHEELCQRAPAVWDC